MNNLYEIKSNTCIAKDVYKMILKGDTSSIKNAGEFLNIQIKGFYLRRPISISDVNENEITIIYKTFGEGTKVLPEYKTGEVLNILTGLGNGFIINNEDSSLLIGGGVGVPPMYNLAKRLLDKGNEVTAVIGFNSADDVFLESELEKLGVNVFVCTMDGSYGYKGTVVDLILNEKLKYNSYYACGPKRMLDALEPLGKGQLSFEERMGCGFGACMGCSYKLKGDGYKRICKEGPVLNSNEVTYE